MNTDKRPRIGIGVIVLRGNKVLLGKRKGAHGEGSWSFPGGHLEFNESIKDCAEREVKEETDLSIKNIHMGTFTNDIFHNEGKHYITLFAIAESASGTPSVLEPDKCECWEWFEWDNLPQPLFLPIQNLLAQGYSPFE